MARMFIEQWSPEYGSSTDTDESLAATMEEIDIAVEVDGPWEPIDGTPLSESGIETVALVDGVRRIDARLTLENGAGPVPGLCGSVAAGSVIWRPGVPIAEFDEVRVDRLALFGSGNEPIMPHVRGGFSYRSQAVGSTDPGLLIPALHDRMRKLETSLASSMARDGHLVISDGRVSGLESLPIVGFIKSHRVNYLPPTVAGIIEKLGNGQRTPLFALADFARYSWYVRLADVIGGHTWSGIARCEISGSLPKDRSIDLADRVTGMLPFLASEPHIDPRAPQNLVPIGALERHLRRYLGDQKLAYRALREAVLRQESDTVRAG